MTRALSDEFLCRDCGATVRWTESKSGSKYLAQRKTWHGDDYGTERVFWPSHRCIPNPAWQAARAEQTAREEALKAAKAAAAEAGTVAPEGRVRDIAAIITKIVNKGDDQFPEWKMTVQTDEGWSAWMTVPQALTAFTGYPSRRRPTVEVGDRITFTATIVRSDRDPMFGFGKRPVVTVDPATVEAREQAKIESERERIAAGWAQTAEDMPEMVEGAARQAGLTVDQFIASKVEASLAGVLAAR